MYLQPRQALEFVMAAANTEAECMERDKRFCVSHHLERSQGLEKKLE